MRKVKSIACIGNMNNMMLPAALYLRDYGYDVTLYLLNEYDHFLPQSDTDGPIDLKVVKLGWTEDNFSSISAGTVRKILKPFDFYIGTDYAPAFCNKANIQLDIFFPAGTDLSDWPFKATKRIIPFRWEYNITLCSLAQFYGIRQATILATDPSNAEFELKITKIRGNAKHSENIPYHYLPFFTESQNQIPDELKVLADLISSFDFKVIQHGRQEWTRGESDIHYKGNERLIKGFKKFIDKTKNNACLILLEYGTNVYESKSLISELGIQQQVIWLPKMLRKQLFQFIKLADIGVGAFGKSWYSSCSLYEIMMAKKPVLTYRDDEYYKNEDLYPILNANSEESVADQLEFACNNESFREQLGSDIYNWQLLKQIKRVDGILKAIQDKEENYSYLKSCYNYIANYPFYSFYYNSLKPLSWLVEFIQIRFTKTA